MAFSRPKKHGALQVPAPATVGGISVGEWTYLDPTTQSYSISASAASGTALSMDSAAFNSGTKEIVIVYSGSHDDGGSAGVNNDIDTGIVWTWPATDIFGDTMRFEYPMVAAWSLELTVGSPFGTGGAMRMTQMMAGLTNAAAVQDAPYSSSALMMASGMRTNDADNKVWGRMAKRSGYTEAGAHILLYRQIGWYNARIDATGRLVGETTRTTSTADATEVHNNLASQDCLETFASNDAHFFLSVGRHGGNTRVTEETVKIKLKVAAMRLGTSWT